MRPRSPSPTSASLPPASLVREKKRISTPLLPAKLLLLIRIVNYQLGLLVYFLQLLRFCMVQSDRSMLLRMCSVFRMMKNELFFPFVINVKLKS
jgi:hypothetical protein